MKIFTYDTLMIPVMKVSNLDGLLLFPTQITHVERKIRKNLTFQFMYSDICQVLRKHLHLYITKL